MSAPNSSVTGGEIGNSLTISIPSATPGVCPGCGRCQTCGRPAHEPPFQPVSPYPWPMIGPIWVAPMTPEQGSPFYFGTAIDTG